MAQTILFEEEKKKKRSKVSSKNYIIKVVLIILIIGIAVSALGLSLDTFTLLNASDGTIDLGDKDIVTRGTIFGRQAEIGDNTIFIDNEGLRQLDSDAYGDFKIEGHDQGTIIKLPPVNTAPTDAGNKLYNFSANLYWNGGIISGGGGAGNLASLTDVTMNVTNFINSLLIQTNSGGAPPTTGGLAGANNNIGIGKDVFKILQSGTNNVGIGNDVLDALATGSNNTCFGHSSGTLITASENTCIGSKAGEAITSGSNLTVIGYDAEASSATATNEVTLGDGNVDTLRCGSTAIASVSDRRDKTDIIESKYGLNFIEKLKPVQFTWNRRVLNKSDENYVHNGKKRIGFIAQDFQDAMTGDENDILDLVNESNPERIEAKYGNLIPILVKSIQELQNKITLLEKIIEK